MAKGGLKLPVRIEGADEVIRALTKLPTDARRELSNEAFDISKSLTDRIKIAGRAQGGQARRAAGTVREVRAGAWPAVQASNTGRARGLLFASEFGMTRRSGWYARGRYFASEGRQYRPHLGRGSYWFFRTAEAMAGWIEREWHKAADATVRRWSA